MATPIATATPAAIATPTSTPPAGGESAVTSFQDMCTGQTVQFQGVATATAQATSLGDERVRVQLQLTGPTLTTSTGTTAAYVGSNTASDQLELGSAGDHGRVEHTFTLDVAPKSRVQITYTVDVDPGQSPVVSLTQITGSCGK